MSTYQKVTEGMRKELAEIVDENHSMGKAIVERDDVTYWLEKFYIVIHRTTASRLKSMRLAWDWHGTLLVNQRRCIPPIVLHL